MKNLEAMPVIEIPVEDNPLLNEGNPETSMPIPNWIKNNAGWWADGQIDDDAFVSGIQYLIKEKILQIVHAEYDSVSETSMPIPNWIKNNAGWWADGQIDDDAFVSGIKYLVDNGIVRIS